MTWLPRFIVLLLLALWMPATMHCELEAISQFSFLQCCCGSEDASSTSTDCSDDVCSTVESGFYKVEDDEGLLDAGTLLALAQIGFEPEAPLPGEDCFGTEPQPPPELSRVWQFFCRTALSPRAPSRVA